MDLPSPKLKSFLKKPCHFLNVNQKLPGKIQRNPKMSASCPIGRQWLLSLLEEKNIFLSLSFSAFSHRFLGFFPTTYPEFLIILPQIFPTFYSQMDLVIDLWTVASQVQWKKQPGHCRSKSLILAVLCNVPANWNSEKKTAKCRVSLDFRLWNKKTFSHPNRKCQGLPFSDKRPMI